MKVLALVIFVVVGSTTGLGSGPYLPSGWRPSGPAFYLPNEAQKPVAAVPLKDAPVQESETSGSSFLREYGPPTEQVQENEATKIQLSQDITQQSLPDPVTEQAFVVIEAKLTQEEATAVNQESETAEENTTESEALVEEKSDIETQLESSVTAEVEATETAVTEGTQKVAKLAVELKTETEKVVELRTEVTAEVEKVEELKTEVTEEAKKVEELETKVVEEVNVSQPETVDANSDIVSAVEEVEKKEVAEVKAAEEGIKNIADALVSLENEIKAQQVQTKEEVTEVKTVVQEINGSVQNTPEGFLEYGPPGFTEYGPPKGDLKTVAEEKPVTSNAINESRKRRYSPKFNQHRKH